MGYATIQLELYKSGIHLTCEDTGADEFILPGDANKLIETINDIDAICNPDTHFTLTEKGKKYLEDLVKSNNKEE